jgi:hypothetical protein
MNKGLITATLIDCIGGYAFVCGNASEGLHHESGKGEKDPRYQPAAEC